jgi:ascorbate-specific PTS system EIIC-type component UlaA
MNRPEIPQVDSAQTLSGLFHQLTTQFSTLFRQELALARTELFQSLTRLLSSLGSLLAGFAMLYMALWLLVVAAIFGLAMLMPVWLAALGLGVFAFLVGFILVQRGRRLLKDAHLAPSHLPESLRKDKDVLLRRTQP